MRRVNEHRPRGAGRSAAHGRYVLDTEAFVLYLTAEEGGAIQRLLREAEAGRAQVMMNVFNLAEVYVQLSSRLSEERLDAVVRAAQALPIHRVSATDPIVYAASRLRAQFGVGAATAIAVATAQAEDATLITAEPLPIRIEGITVRPLVTSLGMPVG